MSIDRIGKGGPPVPPRPVTGGERARSVEAPKPFELDPTRAAGTASVAPVAPPASAALERLRAGEIDLDGYLDLKVDEAAVHLRGLRAADVDALRAALRDQLAHDPALIDLVQRATGQAPSSKRGA